MGRAGLFSTSRGTDQCGDLCIILDAASRHKADYDLLRSYRALKVRYCPSISVVSGKSLRMVVEQRHAIMYEKKVLCNLRVKATMLR